MLRKGQTAEIHTPWSESAMLFVHQRPQNVLTMPKLIEGQSVIARTVRTKTPFTGTITEIAATPKGTWVTVLPDDKAARPFKTRPAFCTPT